MDISNERYREETRLKLEIILKLNVLFPFFLDLCFSFLSFAKIKMQSIAHHLNETFALKCENEDAKSNISYRI